MKVQAIYYKGIEFVRFQQLPADQQLLLQHNSTVDRINILIEGEVYRACIQYKDYCAWYSSVFLKSVRLQQRYTAPVLQPKLSESVEV